MLPSNATPGVPTQETLSIFSAAGIEIVFQWWLENNRRWAERNRVHEVHEVHEVR
jgi:hypothetical protein